MKKENLYLKQYGKVVEVEIYMYFNDIPEIKQQQINKQTEKILDYIDWDEIVLYAVYKYDNKSNSLISADFMILRMNKEKYINLAKKISPHCRLFFKENLTQHSANLHDNST